MEETQHKTSWPLNMDHKGRFFDERPSISELFADMSMWTMENDVEVTSAAIHHRYSDEWKDIVYSATLNYLEN